jgi:hypothetical protein
MGAVQLRVLIPSIFVVQSWTSDVPGLAEAQRNEEPWL